MERILLLPPELIALVYAQADYETLRTLRLTSKACNEFAEPHLFRCINLKVDKESFRRAADIANSKFSVHCRELFYDGRLLPWGFSDPLPWAWGAGYGCEFWDGDVLVEDGASRLVDQFPEEEQEWYMIRHMNALQNQKDIHRGTNETDALHDIMCRLPNLTSIVFESGLLLPLRKVAWKHHPDEWETDTMNGFSEIGRRTLLEPAFIEPAFDPNRDPTWPRKDNFHLKRLLALKHASHIAGKTITSFSAGWIDMGLFREKIALPSSPEMRNFLSNLRHLSVRFADWTGFAVPHDARTTWLASASNVESLDLADFPVNFMSDQFYPLQEDELWKLHFPRLRKIRLSFFFVNGDDVRGFLLSHKSSLEEVVFTDCVLTSRNETQGETQMFSFRTMDKSRERLEWAELFDCMALKMNLRYVDFRGHRWDYCDERSNLKQQIIWYIVKGKTESPIQRLEDQTVLLFGMRDTMRDTLMEPPWTVLKDLQRLI